MYANSFEELEIWKEGKLLYKNIFSIFCNFKDYSFKDQLFRATLSILNNIAEGYDRETKKELKRFLYISRGSCAEVRSMLYLSLDFELNKKEEIKNCIISTKKISAMITSFIKKV